VSPKPPALPIIGTMRSAPRVIASPAVAAVAMTALDFRFSTRQAIAFKREAPAFIAN
jgi:hypothetical protein